MFRNKNILIISPQAWGEMLLSKQHYANEIAKNGGTVYFLNPVIIDKRFNYKMEQVQNSNIYIINYTVFFIKKLKYRLFSFFSIENRKALERIFKKKEIQIDYLWNFDNGLYFNILPFRFSKVKIFHPVDQLRVKVDTSKYDFVFSLSEIILSKIENKNKFFINHGLSENYINFALKRIEELNYNQPKLYETSARKTLAYIGNLLTTAIDRTNFLNIIKSNPNIDFKLIGTHTSNNNLYNYKTQDIDSLIFIKQLISCVNVELLGSKKDYEIIKLFSKIDGFFICYRETDFFKCDNSHKVLEYLSSGKPVYSSSLMTYNESSIIESVGLNKNNQLAKLIKVSSFSSEKSQILERLNYAILNSYENQLKKIKRIIDEP